MTEDKKADKAARIALAIHRAGDDHLGDVNGIHRDLIDILRELKVCRETLREIDVQYQNKFIDLPVGLYAMVKAALL